MASDEIRFQFRVDGRAGNSPIRNTWAEAAADAVRAGYASWRKCGIEIAFDPTSGGEIARLPGRDAEIASLRVWTSTRVCSARIERVRPLYRKGAGMTVLGLFSGIGERNA